MMSSSTKLQYKSLKPKAHLDYTILVWHIDFNTSLCKLNFYITFSQVFSNHVMPHDTFFFEKEEEFSIKFAILP